MIFSRAYQLVFCLAAALTAGGCATTVFDAPPRHARAEEGDETLSWWRLPDRSGRFEPKLATLRTTEVLDLPAADLRSEGVV